MTDEQLAELEALAEKATEGPWVWYNDDNMYGEGGPRKENRFWPEAIIQTDSGYYGPNEKDRAFIAAARTAIPSLIAEVKRLRAVVADRAACEAICLAESVAAPQSLEHPWDRGYRAGAASCWSKIRALATPQEKDHG